MALLPRSEPSFAGWEVSGVCLPASEVGGDFFDTFSVEGDDEQLRVVVGDVSGKGTRAAMAAAMSCGMVHALSAGGAPLAGVMTSVNRSVSQKLGRHMFTAMCLAAIDRRERTFCFVNAGLCEPALRSAGAAVYLAAAPPTLPLGAFRDTAYAGRTVPLAAGDVVVLFTDGVVEAANRDGVQYGYDAFLSFLGRVDAVALGAAGIRDAVVAEVRRYSAGSRLRDDVTVVVVKAL
jgi:sigma-B regulation protein RsbU (phosphoserine phosphatase)